MHRRVMPRSAAGLFRPRRLVYLLWLVGFLHLVWLRDVWLGREIRMMALEVADGLTEVLVRHQALHLHLLEDLAPARVLLLRCNLVEREWRGPSARGLRLEQCPGDLLIPWRELLECAGARRLGPRAHRDAERDGYGEHNSGNVCGILHVTLLWRLTAADNAFGVPQHYDTSVWMILPIEQ